LKHCLCCRRQFKCMLWLAPGLLWGDSGLRAIRSFELLEIRR
jgi:hypothetical protein